MNLLLFEYFSGGGYADQQLSSSILSESYGMIQSLTSDCKAAGHNVTTFLDSRLKLFNPPIEADKIVAVSSPNQVYTQLKEFSSLVDAVYVIAPESDQTLEKLVETVVLSGGTSLNCNVQAIKQVSNKMTNYETLKKAGLKVPETVLLDMNEKTENIKQVTREVGYPLVFKPIDGVSCDGLSIVKDDKDIVGAVKKIAQVSISKQFVVQKQILGNAASACVFSTGDEALAVTLNEQFVALGAPDEESGYYGGVVPFKHKLQKQALRAAERAVNAVTGLKGYVGVDLLLTDEEPVVIEVNPRLTVSYIGLKRAMSFNPGQAIIDTVTRQKLPKNVKQRGYSFFSKVQVPSCSSMLAKTYKLEEVVSPPFPVEKNKSAYALVATSSASCGGAQSAFVRSKKRLLELCGED